MRIFKAFNLLHRRTKSTTFVSGSSLESATTDSEPPIRRSSVPVSLFDLVASQIPANFKHLSDRGSGGSASVALPVFGPEKELNARLIDANNRWAKEYAYLQCQLEECHEELHSERGKVQYLQHKLEEVILDLRMSSGRDFEGLLSVSNHVATADRLQSTISGGTGMLSNPPTMPNIIMGSFTNVMNIRTMDEYSSALRMTLATRKELRDQKKVALFWKRKALDSNQLQSAITPSVSTISSIHDPLPLGRQIALDALISRRGLDSTLRGQMGWKDISSGPPKTLVPKPSTYQMADEVGGGGPITIARLPSMSSENSRSYCLGPLASESIKAEISSMFGSPENIKHLPSRNRREPSHPPSLIGRLTKFTFAPSTSSKTDLTLNVESFSDLHTIFAVRHHHHVDSKVLWLTVIHQTTFGVDKLLVKERNGALNRIDMEDDIPIPMTSILPPPTSVSISSGPPIGSVSKNSNIPTRRGAVTSAGSHNGVTANKCRPWKGYKAPPAASIKEQMVLEGRVPPKCAQSSQKLERGKENSFARAIPMFKRKNSTKNNS